MSDDNKPNTLLVPEGYYNYAVSPQEYTGQPVNPPPIDVYVRLPSFYPTPGYQPLGHPVTHMPTGSITGITRGDSIAQPPQ